MDSVDPIDDVADMVTDVNAETDSEIIDSVVEAIPDVDEITEGASEVVDDVKAVADIPAKPVAKQAIKTSASVETNLSNQPIVKKPASTEASMQAETPIPNVKPTQTAQNIVDSFVPATGPDTSDPSLNPNFLEPSGVWPPPIFLNAKASSQQQRYYVEHRWHSQWAFYDKKASHSKWWYQFLQMGIGVGSVIVPVLVGFNTTDSGVNNGLQILTVVISLLVAAAAAVENVKKYGDSWRNYRAAAEELAREKSLYDMGAGPYRESQRPFLLFAERCEDVIAKQNGAFFSLSQEGTKDKDGDGIPDEDDNVDNSELG